MKGTSGFAEKFAAERPARRQRAVAARARPAAAAVPLSMQLHDLHRGLRRAAARRQGRRLRPAVAVLSGRETRAAVRALSRWQDRQAVVEILRETKKGLPGVFPAGHTLSPRSQKVAQLR